MFPLEVVLFPRTPLPLHVFEDRYKEMVGEILATHSEFGVVLAGEKGIVNTGCTAIVEKVIQKYPDGRMDILTKGRRRFEIILLNDEKSYLRGAVDFFDDDDAQPAPPDVHRKALEGYRKLREVDDDSSAYDPEMNDPQLSFQLAQTLPDLNFRQVLLAMRSEAERMKQLADFFPTYVWKRRETAHMRDLAPRNGHGTTFPQQS